MSDPSAARVAAMYGQSMVDGDGNPLRYPSVLLRTQRDYGEGGANLPRGMAARVADQYLEAKGRPHLNKEDPGSVLAHLRYLVVEKHGLTDLAPAIKRLSQEVSKEWQSYRER